MNLNNIKNYKYKILDKKIIDCYSQYLKQKKFSYNKKYFLRNSFTSTLFYIDIHLATNKNIKLKKLISIKD